MFIYHKKQTKMLHLGREKEQEENLEAILLAFLLPHFQILVLIKALIDEVEWRRWLFVKATTNKQAHT